MIRAHGETPLRVAARVAVAATLIATVIYAVAAAGLVWLVATQLSGSLDDQLQGELRFYQSRPGALNQQAQVQQNAADQGRATGVIWILLDDGSQLVSPRDAPPLPTSLQGTAGPATVSASGHDYRVVGAPVRGGWLMVGAPNSVVTDAIRRLVLGTIVVGVVVLAAIFGAALAIGRWSAEPIDRARRRLLDFTADASHELRTPLQVIEAEVSLALLQERGPTSYVETIRNIGRESGRLHRMVDDLLWLARFDTRPERPDQEVVDARQLAYDAVERFGALARSRSQRLWLQADPVAPAMVMAPREWVDRLLGVLLDNACRYTPTGGAVRVVVDLGDGRVEVRVEDSGPGIAAAERDRIFERFHRARSEGGGAGLGLSIGNAVVAATSGRWRVSDSPFGGASVGVGWPAARPESQPVVPATGAPTVEPLTHAKP